MEKRVQLFYVSISIDSSLTLLSKLVLNLSTILQKQRDLFKAMYMRRVNPNRVTLATELVVDQQKQATMAVSAEYALKQSTLKMSIDSDATLKSSLQSKLSPGVEFHLAAEVVQAKKHYKFGYAIIMG